MYELFLRCFRQFGFRHSSEIYFKAVPVEPRNPYLATCVIATHFHHHTFARFHEITFSEQLFHFRDLTHPK